MITFGKRVPKSGSYVLPATVHAAALAVRLWPQWRALKLSAAG